MKSYIALTGCRNDATGKRFAPGDTVTGKDFPARVIKNWLAIDPPVLVPAEAVEEASPIEEEE